MPRVAFAMRARADEHVLLGNTEVDSANGKAYFRRAQAYEALGKLADAFQDVRELMRLEPSSKEALTFAG